MNCPNCGTEILDGAKFCRGCGAPVLKTEGVGTAPAPEMEKRPVEPASSPAPAPAPAAPAKSGGKTALIVGLVAALIAVAVLATVLIMKSRAANKPAAAAAGSQASQETQGETPAWNTAEGTVAEEAVEEDSEEVKNLLDTIVSKSDSVFNILKSVSVGLLNGDCVRDGHTIRYELQFTSDLGSMESITAVGLQSATGLVEEMLNGYLDDLRNAGVDDAKIVVEFKNHAGKVLFTKDFT